MSEHYLCPSGLEKECSTYVACLLLRPCAFQFDLYFKWTLSNGIVGILWDYVAHQGNWTQVQCVGYLGLPPMVNSIVAGVPVVG